MHSFIRKFLPIADIVFFPFVVAGSFVLLAVRKAGIGGMRLSRAALMKIGVFPVIDHYYDPFFSRRHLRIPLDKDRALPGIDMNVSEQLAILKKLTFGSELAALSREKPENLAYYYDNENFGAGDAEYFYSMIRLHRPKKIIEIGSGYSTLMAINALRKNKETDPDYACEHICIEPYEIGWLETTGVTVVREKVENVDKKIFADLGGSDILFIDSSHVIRPQGDVLLEYLEILPLLKPGVLVHIHDIFTPRDYPGKWLLDEVKFWNEQYLLEAFLSMNSGYRVIGALNFLRNHYFEELVSVCPMLRQKRDSNPGSFWIVRS